MTKYRLLGKYLDGIQHPIRTWSTMPVIIVKGKYLAKLPPNSQWYIGIDNGL